MRKQLHILLSIWLYFSFATVTYAENYLDDASKIVVADGTEVIAEDHETMEEEDADIILDESSTDTFESQDTFVTQDNLEEEESYFDKHFSGGAVVSYSGFINKTTRFNNYFKLRFQDEWEEQGLSAAVSARVFYSGNTVVLETENERTGNKNDVTRKTEESGRQVREAYVRWSRPFFDVYLGRRLLTLGQFSSVSPVDFFILPLDYSNSIISFSKISNKYPQTLGSLILYPLDKLELQLHYFPYIERDHVVKWFFETEDHFKRPSDEGQVMSRMVYTGEDVIWGLTYYKGFGVFPQKLTSLRNDQFYFESTYIETEAYGFEMAIPYGNYSFKYEVVLLDSLYVGEDCGDGTVVAACLTWRNYIKTKLNNDAYFKYKSAAHALGYDYTSDYWTINFALLYLQKFLSSDDDEAIKLSEDSVSLTETKRPDVIPLFHVARHYGTEQRQTTGFGFGLVGGAFGVSLYHAYKYSDDLVLATSFDYLSYTDSSQTEEKLKEEEESTTRDPVSVSTVVAPSLRLSVIYSF